MRLPRSVHRKLSNVLFSTLQAAGFSYARAEKFTVSYGRFVDSTTDVLTVLVFGFSFFYLAPIIFNMSWDRITTVLVFLIFAKLAFGKVEVKVIPP